MNRPHRVVVVGYGMAGARLAEQIRARDPHGDRVALTIVGSERRPAYNRVLLTNAVAGRLSPDDTTLHQPGWGQRNLAEVRTGVSALRIDRAGHRVLLDDHTALDYDTLVLAIGSTPWLPPVAGLRAPDGALAAGVHTFRTYDDCQRIIASAASGEPVAVLGGGLLGLETARGLTARGGQVTVVHSVDRLMERQLDRPAGNLLAEVLSEHGLTFRLDRPAVRYRPGIGLDLRDGDTLPASQVVVTTGVRARTGLAKRSGLAVRRGIVIDDGLRTSDPDIHAIGDCAEHNGQVTGLVDPAWAQADVLADRLTGADPAASYTEQPVVTRLKARDVELVALGDTQVQVDARDAEVLCLHDPTGGRYAKLVVRDDRVAGAILIGLPDAGATISQFYDRALPVPADRLALLLGRVLPDPPAPTDPAGIPDDTVVCRCNTVTKKQLVAAWREHTASRPDLADLAGLVTATRATSGCNGCRPAVRRIADWLATTPPPHAPPHNAALSHNAAPPDNAAAACHVGPTADTRHLGTVPSPHAADTRHLGAATPHNAADARHVGTTSPPHAADTRRVGTTADARHVGTTPPHAADTRRIGAAPPPHAPPSIPPPLPATSAPRTAHPTTTRSEPIDANGVGSR